MIKKSCKKVSLEKNSKFRKNVKKSCEIFCMFSLIL